MNLISTRKKPSLSDKLTNKEVLYLRLYAHGYNSKTIMNKLGLENIETGKLDRRLTKFFKLISYENIVSNAFKDNILKQSDYVETNILELALLQSQTLSNPYVLKISFKDIESKLLEYVHECHMSSINLYNKRSPKSKLTTIERDLIQWNYTYFKFQENFIFQSDIHSNSIARVLQENIFSKLEVNNWFCVFVKSIQLNIIPKEDNYNSVIKKMIGETSNEIIAIKKLTIPKDKEMVSLIYNQLVNMHSKIKFSFLFNDRHLNSKDNKELILSSEAYF